MRGRLVAYVCDCGDVRRTGDMGLLTLAGMFQRRPDGCRYAVVEHLVPRSATGETCYMLVDLYELQTTDGSDALLGKHWVFDTEDAAIAAGQIKH